jgi:hypothetical protein
VSDTYSDPLTIVLNSDHDGMVRHEPGGRLVTIGEAEWCINRLREQIVTLRQRARVNEMAALWTQSDREIANEIRRTLAANHSAPYESVSLPLTSYQKVWLDELLKTIWYGARPNE